MVAQTRTGGQSSPKKLRFHEKLVGKGFSADTILKKLKVLHTELAELDQDTVDKKSLATARQELNHNSILLHKDAGVKAYAACCMADLLRLYAPDAPYTHNELRDIFQFFFHQLSRGLKGPDAPYYNEYFHLLESLSTVKSVVLICDLPNADELMVEVFRDFFGLVRRDLAKKIEIFMADILVALIEESQTLPAEVLEIIMAQFMDKNAGMENAAFRLAVQVCNATADKLQRHVCQYFTDIIVEHSNDEEFDDIKRAHDLIQKLNCSCPALLHNVIPQLEQELRVEDVRLRTLATQVLGEMYADKGGADLARKYPTTWAVWLMRKNDKATQVRLAMVETMKYLIANLPERKEEIEEALQTKLMDPDDKIRAAVCKIFSQIDYETALHHVSESLLVNMAGRGLDKKQIVRVEALGSIGKLFSLAYPEIENGDPAAIRQFAWIPKTILHLSATTQEVRMTAELILSENILPLPGIPSSKGADVDESAWTDRLLTVMKYLDEKSINMLLATSGIKSQRPTVFERFLECCIANNGGVIDENEDEVTQRLNIITQRIALSFPDQQKAADDLHTFAKLNEGRLYKLLKTCMDTQTDLKNLVKSSNEFLRRIEQSSPSILPTMTAFLRKSSLHFINQSSMPTLVKRLQKGDPSGDGHGTSQAQLSANNAQAVLTAMSKHCPALYKPHVTELTKAIADEKNPRLVEVCLQALAAVTEWDEKLAPTDKRTTERVMRFVLESNHRHAKFSARLLTKSRNSEDACADIVDTISMDLPDVDSDKLVAHIAVLAEFARNVPDAFERKSEDIMTFLVKEILMKPSLPDPDTMDNGDEWVENDNMGPELRAKLLSLKVCRNRCLAHASSDVAEDIATPVLRMFTTLLEHSGSLKADSEDDPKVMSRMRTQAAVSLLRLATIEKYYKFTSANFILLAITMQDPCYQVRMEFLRKLIALLPSQKLPAQFNVIPFLTVHDPEADIKSMAKAYVLFAFRAAPPSMKLANFEMIFVRFLHLLAHHPDFALAEEGIPDMAKYIDFYLEMIASADNVSLLYNLAGRLKTVRDSESHRFSENLYALSELAQHIIKWRAHSHNWALQSYPKKVKLYPDILRPLPNSDAVNEILKRTYLPAEALSWLKFSRSAAAETKPKPTRKVTGKRKAPTVPRTNGQAKRTKGRPRRKRYDDASSENEDEDDEEHSGPSEEQSNADDDDDINKYVAGEAGSNSSPSDNEDTTLHRPGRGARTRANAKIKQQVSKKPGRRR